ncbi:MAG TPA: aminotransferase class V-fold PLP-dependent enzyme [Anaerolineae bacterium]|nr:aminotransferase class V-fold PLP-dependent enzyme [Anaerolineae bacterium]
MTIGFDIERARRETRAAEALIHFNNAGASLMPIPVSEAVHAYLRREEMMGGYEAAAAEVVAIENFYVQAGRLLNCEPAEIAFVDSASRAWTMAFYSFQFEPGDRILTTWSEYGSNVIAYNQQKERYGVETVFVPDDEQGQVDVAALRGMVDERVKLISMTHIPTGGGTVNPLAAVGAVAKEAGIPFLVDSCQGVGQIMVDVEALGCDILCGTGRKYLRGPRGTGLLYVRQSLVEKLEPPMLDLRSATLLAATAYEVRGDAKRFEMWEQYLAGKVGLGVAIEYALSYGMEAIQARIYQLAAALRAVLAGVPRVVVMDEGAELCGIVTFRVDGWTSEAIQAELGGRGVNVSVSSGSGSLVAFQKRGVEALVRASVHYYNTEAEVVRFGELLAEIVG